RAAFPVFSAWAAWAQPSSVSRTSSWPSKSPVAVSPDSVASGAPTRQIPTFLLLPAESEHANEQSDGGVGGEAQGWQRPIFGSERVVRRDVHLCDPIRRKERRDARRADRRGARRLLFDGAVGRPREGADAGHQRHHGSGVHD